MHLSLKQGLLLDALFALVAAGLLFRLFPETQASVEGTAEGAGRQIAVKLGGAAAAFVVFFLVLAATPLLFAHQTVQVYLTQGGKDVASPIRIDRFDIAYRRPYQYFQLL